MKLLLFTMVVRVESTVMEISHHPATESMYTRKGGGGVEAQRGWGVDRNAQYIPLKETIGDEVGTLQEDNIDMKIINPATRAEFIPNYTNRTFFLYLIR